ncbi:MAG TPA: ECF-type sigma factor [Bryobacteraceae bacterium]|nr:ECF-type sigma factor [Bryobacteraceae bacterium]
MRDETSSASITRWLICWREGDQEALEQLTRLVYAELRHLAAAMLEKERTGHTLQPTALVHELYLHLDGARGVDWRCRGQFFAISAKVMRRILLDHARKRIAAKRNAGHLVPLDEAAFLVPGPDIIQVDVALGRLAQQHPRQAAVVELRFFGGLTAEETVEALNSSGEDVSLRTVERDWKFSRAWLQSEIAK